MIFSSIYTQLNTKSARCRLSFVRSSHSLTLSYAIEIIRIIFIIIATLESLEKRVVRELDVKLKWENARDMCVCDVDDVVEIIIRNFAEKPTKGQTKIINWNQPDERCEQQ